MEHHAIQFDEDAQRLRISWRTSELTGNGCLAWFLGIFWIIWMPATLVMTWMAFHDEDPLFIIIWCVFGWFGTIVIPLNFWEKSHGNGWVELDAEGITLGTRGFIRRKIEKRLPFTRLEEIVIGADPKDEAKAEKYDTYVWTKLRFHFTHPYLGSGCFYTVTQWMGDDDEDLVFDRLRHHARKHNLPVTFVRHPS
jgi:hypothetical protein